MYHGKYEPKRPECKCRRKISGKAGMLLLSLLLMVTIGIGGTIAYLITKTAPVNNTFTPSKVDCEVTEDFDGTTKSNVNVENTGDTDAYIRVKLVTYRVNEAGEHIGGTATIPDFKPGEGWKKSNGYYYYTKSVAPGDKPANNLIESIKLTEEYNDSDGGKQVIIVMAEAIQSEGVDANTNKKAVEDAWGINPETHSGGGEG